MRLSAIALLWCFGSVPLTLAIGGGHHDPNDPGSSSPSTHETFSLKVTLDARYCTEDWLMVDQQPTLEGDQEVILIKAADQFRWNDYQLLLSHGRHSLLSVGFFCWHLLLVVAAGMTPTVPVPHVLPREHRTTRGL